MTEMIEVANIINNATKHSFVIFDELGRGTSTYDGLSITRAIIEYFATQVKCNVLVATHYHELITLADSYTSIKNFHVGVYDNDHEVVFLKKVLPGGMEKSYGLEVARLAGISKQILEQAKHYLSGYTNQTQHPQHQENLFWSFIGTTSQADDKSQKILWILDNTDINTMTPIQAMQVLIKIMELKS